MAFQTVPPQSDLQASIPAGRMAVTIRPYTKPSPAFGPGSVEYVQQYAEELDLLVKDGESEEKASASPLPQPSSDAAAGNYAGAGSYF